MKLTKLKLLIAMGVVLLLSNHERAQSQFVKTLGGGNSDGGHSVIEASDGGLVVTGYTENFGAGGRDFLLSKFDATGNHLWTKTFGGSNIDYGWSVIEASDGGFVMTGHTNSFGVGMADFLLARFDTSGNHLWTRTLGGGSSDYNYSVIEASDGGLVVSGYTYNFGVGDADLLLSKFDASGNHLWSRTLGGSLEDYFTSMIEASDGGLVVIGSTRNFGAGGYDLILAKFDASGNHLWTRTLGGTSDDRQASMVQTSDGGLVVAGNTYNFGAVDSDLLLSKFNASGNHLWTRTLGGGSSDYSSSVIEASDGGLVVTGYTYSFGAGDSALLLSKFDASGNHLWTRTLGGCSSDYMSSVIEASDGGLVVTGSNYSFGAGNDDLLLSKFDASGNTCLGNFVTPTVQSVSPTVTSPTPTVTSPSPTITSPSPTITSPIPTITEVCEVPPGIISISDVGNDQGKQVRVKWHRCYYDTVGAPFTITEYSLWRRIGVDKAPGLGEEILPSNLEMWRMGRVYPPGDWDFIETVPAIGEEEYNTVCPTLGDSTLAEGMYWSIFFVIAHTQEPLVHYDSDPDSGYSLDNIPPLPIRDMNVNPNSWYTLRWTVPGEYPEEHPLSTYDIRYNTVPVGIDTQAWWNNATACSGSGFFNYAVGQTDSLKVAKDCGCHPNVYFAIKGLDDRPNTSPISNFYHFICGDANNSGVVEVGDIMILINYLYRGGSPPQPMAKGDANCNEVVEVGDVLLLINYLFRSGPSPCGS